MARPLTDEGLRHIRQVLHIDVCGQLAVLLRSFEYLGEDHRCPLQMVVARKSLAVALEDRLDDEFRWVAAHGPLEVGEHRPDDRGDVVGLGQHLGCHDGEP